MMCLYYLLLYKSDAKLSLPSISKILLLVI